MERALTDLESLGSLQVCLARRMCESKETVAAGWSPISPNRTLGRRCRLGPNWGPWCSVEGRAVVVAAIAVMAVAVVVVFIGWVVVVVVIAGPAVIGASSGCNSAAMRLKGNRGTESARRIRDLLVLDKHLYRHLHRWMGISLHNLCCYSLIIKRRRYSDCRF